MNSQSVAARRLAAASVAALAAAGLLAGQAAAQGRSPWSTPPLAAAGRLAAEAPVPEGADVSLPLVWQSDFRHGLDDWPGSGRGWGEANRSFVDDAGIRGRALQLWLPRGSIDPGTMKRRGQPYGGTGFRTRLPGPGYETARLRYMVRFPADFEQGMGGKLPGLCGGACNSGGKMPDGTDGFSVRYMWTGNFAASVYAYLPTSRGQGTPIGSRQIPLKRGVWVELIQEVRLNSPAQADGYLKVWSDGVLVVNAHGLVFRFTDRLRIDKLLVDVFYGGNTDEWAAPKDTAIAFADFSVWAK